MCVVVVVVVVIKERCESYKNNPGLCSRKHTMDSARYVRMRNAVNPQRILSV
jgi:hypothetical protein